MTIHLTTFALALALVSGSPALVEAAMAKVAGPSQGKSAASEWQGEYSATMNTDDDGAGSGPGPGPEESWGSHLSIGDCVNGKTCKFDYFSGSAQSDCAASGEFQFKSSSKAESIEIVKPTTDDGPRGQCLLTFERRKNGAVFVDSKDVFKSNKDEEFGNPCNTLCGFQGARYFGIEIPKVSSKKFYSPSFSCYNGKLTKLENEICTTESLAQSDRDLSDAVAKIKVSEPKSVAKLTTDQRAWLKARNSKCAKAPNLGLCLADMYRERTTILNKMQAQAPASH
jgi:uncharacterized protein YecT (DUF1311 family)